MRDVQKGRKSWLERLTSPPETEGDDNVANDAHRFERTLEPGPPAPRDPHVPEGFEAFAPPGLRPPPSDDLKSAPPERANGMPGPGPGPGPGFEPRDRGQFEPPQFVDTPPFEQGRVDAGRTFDPDRGRFDPDRGKTDSPLGPDRSQFEADRSRFEPDRSPFEPKPHESTSRPPVPTSAATTPRDSWEGPVTTSTRSDDATPSDTPRLQSVPSTPSGITWQPDASQAGNQSLGEPKHSDIQDSRDEDDSDPLEDTGEELSRPSEAEQLEAARKRHVEELQHRWLVTQAQILDDPRDAVREAGLLIGDAMQFVTSTFTDHRDRIEREWRHNDSMSTDELRTVMRRYRNLFQYVLSASQLPDL
ncbi:hypothetical protein ABN028_08640 [Actinopolymorpha sp. B17G11]|uniref:hypothetical protein n=1 Tax=unclassified Actinopolymorpha TaxID=2627063 RepID=UPI0032D984AB